MQALSCLGYHGHIRRVTCSMESVYHSDLASGVYAADRIAAGRQRG